VGDEGNLVEKSNLLGNTTIFWGESFRFAPQLYIQATTPKGFYYVPRKLIYKNHRPFVSLPTIEADLQVHNVVSQ
jgi:hypothetical protein